MALRQKGHSFVLTASSGRFLKRPICFTMRNTANATIKKFITALINEPSLKTPGPGRPIVHLLRSTKPVSKLRTGEKISTTKEFTTVVNAAPMITPMAKSMAFPLMANSLNSLSILLYKILNPSKPTIPGLVLIPVPKFSRPDDLGAFVFFQPQ